MLHKNRIIMAKIGTDPYPTDPVPTEGADAMLMRDSSFVPQPQTVTLRYDRPNSGAGKEFITGKFATLSGIIDMAPSGTAGTPPAWGPLMRMCSWAETVDSGVSVAYTLVRPDLSEWGGMYFNLGEELHKLLGVRGTVDFTFDAAGMPQAQFQMQGLWDLTPVTAVQGAVDYSAFEDPLPINKVNTPTFTIDGYAAKMSALSLSQGNTVEYSNIVNEEAIRITDREMTGNCTIDAPALSDKDFWALIRGRNVVNTQLVHGQTAGSILTLDLKTQLMINSAHGDRQGIATLPLNMRCIPTPGSNDEATLTLT